MWPSTKWWAPVFWRASRNARPRRSPQPHPGGVQVVDAPLARQSSAASGKPARLGGTARRARSRFPQENSNGIPDLTDLFLRWRKFLTAEARTPNMAVAPASAVPPYVDPLIRIPA